MNDARRRRRHSQTRSKLALSEDHARMHTHASAVAQCAVELIDSWLSPPGPTRRRSIARRRMGADEMGHFVGVTKNADTASTNACRSSLLLHIHPSSCAHQALRRSVGGLMTGEGASDGGPLERHTVIPSSTLSYSGKKLCFWSRMQSHSLLLEPRVLGVHVGELLLRDLALDAEGLVDLLGGVVLDQCGRLRTENVPGCAGCVTTTTTRPRR
jgi:hypothetical protein